MTTHPIPGRITSHDTRKLQDAINKAPQYNVKAASVLKHIIKVIHRLPKMHRNLRLQDIEIYIGKSANNVGALSKRWKLHQKNRHHIFGMVLFSCTKASAKTLEKLAIRIIKRLKDNNSLCVGQANVSSGSGGRDQVSGQTVIYMTWAPLLKPTGYVKPTVKIIKAVAMEVVHGMNNAVKEQQVLTGLGAITQVSTYTKLRLDAY